MTHAGVSHRSETRALDAVVRACRRVFCEYQGQLLWKAVAVGGGDTGRRGGEFSAAFEAEVSGFVFPSRYGKRQEASSLVVFVVVTATLC